MRITKQHILSAFGLFGDEVDLQRAKDMNERLLKVQIVQILVLTAALLFGAVAYNPWAGVPIFLSELGFLISLLFPVDFERDNLAEALAGHGHRTSDRTFFVWEGVTQYLSEAGVRATFDYLSTAASGSRLVFTYVRADFIDGTHRYGAESLYRRFRVRRQIWQFGLNPDDVAPFIEPYGWQLIEQAGPDYLTEHYISPTGRKLGASQVEWTAYAQRP